MPSTCPRSGKEDVLYMCYGDKIPQNALVKFVTRFNDGKPSYTLITFRKLSETPETLPSLPDGLEYVKEVVKKDTDGVIPGDSKSLWE